MNTNNKLIVLNEVDSTNRFALGLLQDGAKIEEGTAIMSFFQSAGKGQRGNVWESERGSNMLASVVLFPEFMDPTDLYLINQVASLSICSTLNKISGLEFKIKWPNDILFGEKKVAGILVENSIRDKKCITCIVGAGINLNQEYFNNYEPRAISLKTITGNTIDSIPEFTTSWRNTLMDYFELIRNGEEEKINASYSQLLFGLEENRFFEYEGTQFMGIIKGVNKAGHLLIQTGSSIRLFGIKEVRYLFGN